MYWIRLAIWQEIFKKRYIIPQELHVTISPAAQQKANAMYESVSSAYSQGKRSSDEVVEKAFYH